ECQNKGTSLITPKSRRELDFIEETFGNSGIWVYSSVSSATEVYKWSDGMRVGGFMPGQPSHSAGNTATLSEPFLGVLEGGLNDYPSGSSIMTQLILRYYTMASKLKQNKPEVILQAVAQSTENANVKSANIYQYDVEKPPTEGIKIYNKNLVIRPWLLFIAINLIALLVFGAIGYGIGIGISSAYPKLHGDFCNSTNECSQSDNLLCVDLTCTCPTTKYFNGLTCVDRLSYGAVCTNLYQNECAYGLGCFYNGEKRTGICDCSTERFWDTRTNYCELKYSYNQNGCTNSEQCANGANMICSSSVCTCDSSNFWNGTQCGPIATYMQNCSIQTNCDSTKSLVCSMVGENLYKCLCSATDYWSSTTCTAKLGYSIGCSDDGQCREDLGLTCSGTCSCLNTHYWDSTICQRKKQNGIACASPSECDDNIGLTVCSVTCNCPSLYFYNGTACQFDLVSGLNCDSSFDCDTTKGLLCDAATKQCVCPVNEFWDYTTCVAKRTSGQDCVHDIQCRDDLGLSCDVDNTKKCICLSTHYWTSSICSSKVSEGVSCSSNPNCQDYNGLECSAGPGPVCRCPTNYYWNNTLCVIQLLFDEPCSGALSGIMCMTTKGLACDGTTNTCRCSSAANYWDSTDCVAKLDYDVSCQFQVTTLTNPQCDERSPKFLICRAIDFATNNFRCRCPSDRRWDSASTSCIVKNTYKGTCASGQDSECQDYNGLICNTANNTCLCPVTKYWDTTDTICSKFFFGFPDKIV
ncbi:prion-like-(Q N-rich) domain-bearing 25, partial [Brachionus plicatilis]